MDYCFYCFGGEPFMISVDVDTRTDHKCNYMTPQWERLPIRSVYPNSDRNLQAPSNLEEMVTVARKLSRQFPFVRVDLYAVDGKTYFGELTFTPSGGLNKFSPKQVDFRLGSLIDINEYK
jgi:hypothetical protein